MTVKDLQVNDPMIRNNNEDPDPAPKVRIKVPLTRIRIRKKIFIDPQHWSLCVMRNKLMKPT
jgi:hypothetical protein